VPMPNSRATSAIVRPSEDRYKSIARALNSGATLLGLLTISSSLGPIRPRSRASRKAGEPQINPTHIVGSVSLTATDCRNTSTRCDPTDHLFRLAGALDLVT